MASHCAIHATQRRRAGPGPLAAPLSAASVDESTVEVCGLRYPAIAPVSRDAGPPVLERRHSRFPAHALFARVPGERAAQWPGERDMEIVVVDNGSDPPLAELVQSLGQGIVRYHRHARTTSLQQNWNSAIAASRGRWVHLLNDDDYVLPGFYARLRAKPRIQPESVGAAFTGYENIDEHDQVVLRRQVYGVQRGIPRTGCP
jgi:hypothetical protein